MIDGITQALNQRFSVHHSALQIEQGTAQVACGLQAKQVRDLPMTGRFEALNPTPGTSAQGRDVEPGALKT